MIKINVYTIDLRNFNKELDKPQDNFTKYFSIALITIVRCDDR